MSTGKPPLNSAKEVIRTVAYEIYGRICAVLALENFLEHELSKRPSQVRNLKRERHERTLWDSCRTQFARYLGENPKFLDIFW